MSTLTIKPLAQTVSFDSGNMWVELVDGRKLSIPLAYFPRLLHASSRQRKKYEMSGGGAGLHWDEINEDISVKSLLMGYGDQTSSPQKTPLKLTAHGRR